MLDNIQNKLQGAVLGVIVALLCAVFILQFGGPQAQGCSRQDASAGWAAEVRGETIAEGDFRAAFNLSGGANYPVELAKQNKLRENVLEGLIERNLLAHEARRIGISATKDEVMQRLANDGVLYLSRAVDAPESLPGGPLPIEFEDEQGHFDEEMARGFIQYQLRRSVEEFAEAQVLETLAQRMRETVTSGVAVSPEEVWDAYRAEKERVTLEFVRYSPVYYRDRLEPTAAELDAFIQANAARIGTEYEARKSRYQDLEKQVRARHILIKAGSDATDEAKRAARGKAEALLAQLRAGADFASLARANSDDTGSARKGGDLGFNPRGRMVGPFDDAQFALSAGQISDIVETNFGYHIIQTTAVREGTVPEVEAKREIAEELYREERSKTLAQQTATEALTALRGGETVQQLGERLRVQTGTPAAPAADDATVDTREADPFAPRVEETRSFGRGDAPIPGPDSGALGRAAFELTTASPLPSAPLRIGEDWIVFRLKERVDARREDMTPDERARLEAGLLTAKQREALLMFVHTLRAEAERDGDIRRNEKVLRYEPEGAAEEEDEDSEEGGEDRPRPEETEEHSSLRVDRERRG